MTALPTPAAHTVPADPATRTVHATHPVPAGTALGAAGAGTVPVPSATTPADETWVRDPALIRAGDRIEVWEQETLRHVGTVGQAAPHLGLLWVLEAGTGARRLVPVHGYRLRRSPAPRAA